MRQVRKVIGMDGGGTRLRVSLIEGEEFRSFSYDFGVNVSAVAEEHIRSLLKKVREDTGGADFIVVAFAGAGDRIRREKIRLAISDIFSEAKIEIISDLEGLHRACFDKDPGVVVVSGTGTGVFGRDHRGEPYRAGGWGHLFDDEGSAFWISVEIAKHALRWKDGVEDVDPVFGRLKEFYQLESIEDLINIQTETNFKSSIAAFARTALETDSSLVTKIVEEGICILAARVKRVMQKAGIHDRISVSGGMFSSERYMKVFRERLESVHVDRFDGRVDEELARITFLSSCQ